MKSLILTCLLSLITYVLFAQSHWGFVLAEKSSNAGKTLYISDVVELSTLQCSSEISDTLSDSTKFILYKECLIDWFAKKAAISRHQSTDAILREDISPEIEISKDYTKLFTKRRKNLKFETPKDNWLSKDMAEQKRTNAMLYCKSANCEIVRLK